MSRNVSSKGWTEKWGEKKQTLDKDQTETEGKGEQRYALMYKAWRGQMIFYAVWTWRILFHCKKKKPAHLLWFLAKGGRKKKKAHFLQVSLMFACQVLINLRYLAEFLPSAAKHNHIQFFFFFLDPHLGQLVCLHKQIKVRHLNSAAPSWRPTGVGTKQIIQMNSQASFFLFNRSTSWRKERPTVYHDVNNNPCVFNRPGCCCCYTWLRKETQQHLSTEERGKEKQRNQPCWKTISRKFKYCLSPSSNHFIPFY